MSKFWLLKLHVRKCFTQSSAVASKCFFRINFRKEHEKTIGIKRGGLSEDKIRSYQFLSESAQLHYFHLINHHLQRTQKIVYGAIWIKYREFLE